MAWYRFKFKKLRLLLAWIAGPLIFLSSRSTDDSFRVGVPIVIAGILIRLWATGYIERKGKKLATDGPFAFVRNPLYISNLLIGLGIVVITRNPWIIAVFLMGFAVLYFGTVRDEEKVLRETFGKPYEDYLRAVPRFVPRLTPYEGREKVPFRWAIVWKHREYVTILGILALFAGLYLWEELVIEKEAMMWKEHVAMGVGLTLVAVLVFEKIFRD